MLGSQRLGGVLAGGAMVEKGEEPKQWALLLIS